MLQVLEKSFHDQVFLGINREQRVVTHLDTQLVALFGVKYYSSEWKHTPK